ncbi:MAG: helix-turn-helix transcriptional regulator [candidate division NC10 bacterium]|nr:helix-turn-helix transcriptional regulator [candidate division NC10 bacterium]
MSPSRRTVPGCETFQLDPAKIRRLEPTLKRTEGLAEVFAILADATRTKILFALCQEELCVCDLAGLLGLSVSTVSHHLRLLRMARLVRHRKDGRMVYYHLADDHIVTLMRVCMAHIREGQT